MARPALPPLKVGDALIMVTTARGYRAENLHANPVRVVAVGRKYVHVVRAEKFDTYDRETDRWLVRKFLIADQKEGEPGTRVGYPTQVVTAEQHAYDQAERLASDYLAEQGIDVQYGSRWHHRKIDLAAAVKTAIDA